MGNVWNWCCLFHLMWRSWSFSVNSVTHFFPSSFSFKVEREAQRKFIKWMWHQFIWIAFFLAFTKVLPFVDSNSEWEMHFLKKIMGWCLRQRPYFWIKFLNFTVSESISIQSTSPFYPFLHHLLYLIVSIDLAQLISFRVSLVLHQNRIYSAFSGMK